MKRYLRLVSFMLIIFFTIILVKCAVNPVTGKKEIMLISQSEEINMGKEIDRAIRIEYGLYYDPAMSAYVERVGRQIVPYTHRPNLEYHFAILDTPVENAFAAPGGYIYITRGLLALMNSEAELATVLAHELGHVSARHSARHMTRAILFELGIVLAATLSKDFRKIAPISLIATQLLFLKFSRDDEYQADSLGIDYSFKTGYDSGKMVDFFNSLEKATRVYGSSKLPNFLSTHPVTAKRINRIKELWQGSGYALQAGDPPLLVERNGYLKGINGLVYGVNPRQGFVENGVFYHPDMAFAFQVPRGWTVTNTPLQVTLSPTDGKAVIIMQAEKTTDSLDSYAAKMTKDMTATTVFDRGFRYINGFNAYRSVFSLVTATEESGETEKKEELAVNIACIRKEAYVFSFFSAAASPDYSQYESLINRTINSFSQLKNTAYLSRKPQRVYTKQVTQPQTLQDFLQVLRVPSQHWQHIALLNSLEMNQSLSRGQLIKVIL